MANTKIGENKRYKKIPLTETRQRDFSCSKN